MKTTADWCNLCDNNKDRGCDALHLAATTGAQGAHPKLSTIGAGFIGAGVTIAVALAVIGFLALFGVIGFGKSRRSRKVVESYSNVGDLHYVYGQNSVRYSSGRLI